eukprot:m.31731 g.31731  ORF g.31731 m.31731 type:complete len:147 (-) comp9826_c0_seq1:125-565(-)
MSGGNYYFVIVGPKDNPLFEQEFGPDAQSRASGDPRQVSEDHRHLNQFVVHSALDVVDQLMWTTQQMTLKTVDKFNDWLVSAFVTAGSVRFMLLHDQRNDDGIKNFFTEIHELYVKALLNPFYELGTPISSGHFRSKVAIYARKFL